MDTDESIASDANLAAQYFKLLIVQGLERSEALDLTRSYIMSKVSQQSLREDREAQSTRAGVIVDDGRPNMMKRRVGVIGVQHSPSTGASDE